MITSRKNQSSPQNKKDYALRRTTELKALNPLMSDEEIMQKIQHQWSTNNKQSKIKEIQQSKSKSSQNIRQNNENIIEQIAPQTKVARKLQFKDEKNIKKEIEDLAQQKSQSQKDSSLIEQSQKESSISRTKKISKKTQYTKFYISYYAKLRNQHPSWTFRQMAQIIPLLWRKRKSVYKKSLEATKRIANKLMSGKALFADVNMKEIQAEKTLSNQLWKALPRQSKRYWSKVGKNPDMEIFDSPKKNRSFERILFRSSKNNANAEMKVQNKQLFSFMNMVM